MAHNTSEDDDADYPINFTKVRELLKLADAYLAHANSCHEVGARLASCIMLGATIEAFLIAFFSGQVDEASIYNLLKQAKTPSGIVLLLSLSSGQTPSGLNRKTSSSEVGGDRSFGRVVDVLVS
jgi:hypothetical protein